MNKLFLLLLFLQCFIGNAQKGTLNLLACGSWPKIAAPQISSDGIYTSYSIVSKGHSPILIIQSTDNLWKKEIPNASNGVFAGNDNLFVFKIGEDTLAIMKLGSDKCKKIVNVLSFKVSKKNNSELVAYQLNDFNKTLILLNIITNIQKEIKYVSSFFFSDCGAKLMLQLTNRRDSASGFTILWLNLVSHSVTVIMHTKQAAHDFTFDNAGEQVAFISEEYHNSEKFNVLNYYKEGMDSAIVKVNSSTVGMKDMILSNEDEGYLQSLYFSHNGKKLFFQIHKQSDALNGKLTDTSADVDVWGYQDDRLQSLQQHELINERRRGVTAVISTTKCAEVIRLQKNYKETYWDIGLADGGDFDYVLIRNVEGDYLYESYWKKNAQSTTYLVSTVDGSRRLVKGNLMLDLSTLSPHGRYVVWYDFEKRQYFTYNTFTGRIKHISKKITVPLYDIEDDRPGLPYPYGIAAWSSDDCYLYIYDQYDIWKLDLEADELPVNITHSYGREKKIILRCISTGPTVSHLIFKKDSSLLLTAFNSSNKYNGFYKQSTRRNTDPVELMMGPFSFYFQTIYPSSEISLSPLLLKAANCDKYILSKESVHEYPNLLFTVDFKAFNKLSDIEPQAGYNWMTAELTHWKMVDGTLGEGILYKPENFDSSKKYPVIFYFYERFADGLNVYITPELSGGPINIPFFVSNGYLVFVPDIHYKKGFPGESAYKTVISAAKYLSSFPWVNPKRMALQGHSFGGFEVNYILTKSNMFAAAISAAGLCDFVANYNSLRGGKMSAQYVYEVNQLRIGANLWERPDLYIKNSPIFHADKVNTPLLIMHNKNDAQVPWEQGIEWFTALRRLGKKAWMLQYNGEPHVIIYREKNKIDYTFRILQFLDYYLKEKPAPQWINEQISLK